MNKVSIPLKPAVPPMEPTLKDLKRLNRTLFLFSFLGRWLLWRKIRGVEISGKEYLHAPGPKIILMNHYNAFDPLLPIFFGKKVIHFLVTEPFMRERFLSKLMAYFGQITKRKLDPDTRSIRVMKKWCELGGAVGMFPEGHFSWDGNPVPLQPGLGDLIKYLNVPVVIVRQINGDRLLPAWAKKARTTKLRLEIDAPLMFSNNDSSESVMKIISDKIKVDPETCVRFPVLGNDLSLGLSKVIRFCFQCFSDASLRDDGDDFYCISCKKRFTINSENKIFEKNKIKLDSDIDLNSKTMSRDKVNLLEVFSIIRNYLESSWKNGIFLHGLGTAVLFDATRNQWNEIAAGTFSLKSIEGETILYCGDFQLPMNELIAHTLDFEDLVLLRTKRVRYALKIKDDSKVVWTMALNKQMILNEIVNKKTSLLKGEV